MLLAWLALALGALALFVSAWTLVPAPTMPLLVLGVAVPELSPWVVLLDLLALAAAVGALRRGPSARVHSTRVRRIVGRAAVSAAAVALALALVPSAQAPGTAGRLARAMRDGLGADLEAAIPAERLAGMRRVPLSVADVFRGIEPDPAGVVAVADTVVRTPAGVELQLRTYRPARGGGPHPAVVVIYGGAWQRGSPVGYPELSRYLAARGFVVFAIDYRHAPAHRFPAQLEDVRTMLAYVRAHAATHGADAGRIALLGRSAGGHLALLAAYEPGVPPVRAVVSYYGPADLAGGWADPPAPDPIGVREVLETLIGGTPAAHPAAYRDASPVTLVRPGLPPTLLVTGARDHIVKPRFPRELHRRLREARNPAALLELPWAEHAFDAVFHGLGNQLALYHTERFLAWATR